MPDIYYASYNPVPGSIPAVREKEHRLGRELLRLGLERLYGIPLSMEELENTLRILPNGKPVLDRIPQLHFNITHCDRLAACAFHSSEIGIDAELPGYFAEILVKKALTEKERAFMESMGTSPESRAEWFFRFWTLKEAFVKRSGIGVDTSLHAFSFDFGPAAPEVTQNHGQPALPSLNGTEKTLPVSLPVTLPVTEDGYPVGHLSWKDSDPGSDPGSPSRICCREYPEIRIFQTKLASGHILSSCYCLPE